MNGQDIRKYADMLELPHHVSATHPRMDIPDRAAQFAPFAALSGYGDAIRRTARLAEERMESEYADGEEEAWIYGGQKGEFDI